MFPGGACRLEQHNKKGQVGSNTDLPFFAVMRTRPQPVRRGPENGNSRQSLPVVNFLPIYSRKKETHEFLNSLERIMKHPAVLFFVVLVAWFGAAPCSASDNLIAELSDFFRPVTAQVILQSENTVALDRGSRAGVAPGDLFAVVEGQTKVPHPDTGETLDTLVDFGPMLRVTRVKPDLSYGTLLNDGHHLPAGTKLKRFENVPVYFLDISGAGFQVFSRLRQQLPHLLWRDYLSGESARTLDASPRLVIENASDEVRVLDQEERILFARQGSFAATTQKEKSVRSSNGADSAFATGKKLPAKGPTPWEVARIRLPEEGNIEALEVVDLNNDGQPELLLGLDGELLMGRLEGKSFIEICRVTREAQKLIVNITAMDLDGDGAEEVAVTLLEDGRFESRIFKCEKDRLVTVATSAMLYAAFSPDGAPAVLLGQNKSTMLNYQPEFFQITLEDGRIITTPYELPLVRQPYGVTQLADDEIGPLLSFLSDDYRLQVADRKKRLLWESSQNYGGSNAYVKVFLEGSRSAHDYEKFFLKGPLQKTGEASLLTTRHDVEDLFRNNPSFKNGKIVELAWNGVSLEEVRVSKDLGGFVNDMTIYDLDRDTQAEILASVVLPQNGFFASAGSALFVLSASNAR